LGVHATLLEGAIFMGTCQTFVTYVRMIGCTGAVSCHARAEDECIRRREM